MEQPRRKIAIISNSLSRGGAERFAAVLGRMLENLGHELHHVVIEDAVDYAHAGTLYNLGAVCKDGTLPGRKIRKGLLLRRYLKTRQIDTVIDNRSRNIFIREWFTKWIYSGKSRIYMVHSYNLKEYFPQSAWLSRMLYADAKKLICVSKAIADSVQKHYQLDNAVTIYNPVDAVKPVAGTVEIASPYLLFFGRLEEKVKNFELMLEAFSASHLFSANHKLVIMGNGPDADHVKKTIKKWNLDSHVILLPFEQNPLPYVAQARFTVLTSRYEGFPMSILESLAVGTPVLSVDCLSGPAEIIQSGYNGLLVKNHDAHALADAMRKLALDSNLYDICRQNAQKSIAHLSTENISRQWRQTLSEA